VGFCPRGFCPRGFCPRGFCPDTVTTQLEPLDPLSVYSVCPVMACNSRRENRIPFKSDDHIHASSPVFLTVFGSLFRSKHESAIAKLSLNLNHFV